MKQIKDLAPLRDGPGPREVLHELLDYMIDNDLPKGTAEQVDGCAGRFRRFRLVVDVWEGTIERNEK